MSIGTHLVSSLDDLIDGNNHFSYLEFIDIPIWKGMGTENQNRIIETIKAYRGVI